MLVSREVIIGRLDEILKTIQNKEYEMAFCRILDLKSLIQCDNKDHDHKD